MAKEWTEESKQAMDLAAAKAQRELWAAESTEELAPGIEWCRGWMRRNFQAAGWKRLGKP